MAALRVIETQIAAITDIVDMVWTESSPTTIIHTVLILFLLPFPRGLDHWSSLLSFIRPVLEL